MGGTSSSRDVITAEDIAAANVQTAYDAIQRLQPNWLSARGAGSVSGGSGVADVYMGGVNMGDVEYLRSVQATDVKQMRFYDAGQASTRFGQGHPRGVIELTLK